MEDEDEDEEVLSQGAMGVYVGASDDGWELGLRGRRVC